MPRSNRVLAPGRSQESGAERLWTYVAVPEKYFTPAFALRVQDSRFASVIRAGAPQFGGKSTSQGPVMAVRKLIFALCRERAGFSTGWRKTTKTDSLGASSSGTVVRLPEIAKLAGSIAPVSGCQNSASLPATRKRASKPWARSVRLARK